MFVNYVNLYLTKGDAMDRPNKTQVRQAIKQLKKLRFTHEDIAYRLRVSVLAVRNWEAQKSTPNWPTFDAMLVILQTLKKGIK